MAKGGDGGSAIPGPYREIRYDKGWHDHTALVTIDRPKQHNSYTLTTLKELISAFDASMWDDDVQFIVLTGSGEKAFSTGGNADEYANEYGKKPSDWWKWGEIYGRFLDAARRPPIRPSRCRPIRAPADGAGDPPPHSRSEEHTSELQSPKDLVCRLLLEKKK